MLLYVHMHTWCIAAKNDRSVFRRDERCLSTLHSTPLLLSKTKSNTPRRNSTTTCTRAKPAAYCCFWRRNQAISRCTDTGCRHKHQSHQIRVCRGLILPRPPHLPNPTAPPPRPIFVQLPYQHRPNLTTPPPMLLHQGLCVRACVRA